MREEHKEIVLKQLEKTYGETDHNAPFESRIMELAQSIAFDTYKELLADIDYVKEGSFLEELDDFNVGVMLRDTLASSIAYTLLSRCGADMEQWADELNFEHIQNFNTMKTLSVMGSATTELCKPVLMEIGRTIGSYDRQIARNKAVEMANGEQIDTHEKNIKLGLANESESDYNALKRESKKTDKEKEDVAYDNHIREERGLSDSEYHSEQGAGTGTHEVRTDEEELSEGASQGDLQRHGSFGRAEGTLSEDTGAGRGENGASDRANGENRGSERGTESQRPDELGSEDEQYQTFGGGDGFERADLQLEVDEELNTEKQESDREKGVSASGSFSVPDFTEELRELQKGILCSDRFLIHKRPEIAGYFQIELDSILQSEYLKNSYRMNEFTELDIGEVRGGYRADEDGITLWKGNYLTREAECRLTWEEARYWVNSYIEDGTYLLPGEVAERIETDGMFQQMDLFTMFSEQVGNVAMKQIEEPSSIMPLGFTLPEKELDAILRTGGGREDSRKRIYAKYQQRKTPKEMEAFLRKEYATTGKGFEIDGKQIAVWFDESGMRVGYGTSATEQPLVKMDWKEIESHIRRQVENGTYMSANEAYLVDSVERDRIAGHIFFFFRDGIGEMPEELELKLGNYPDSHQKLMELLATDEGRELIGDLMDNELIAIEMGEKKLRFRSVMPADELREEITNLGISKYTFPLSDSVEVKHEDFITQDEIDNRLGRGSGFSHGAFRIYVYFKAGYVLQYVPDIANEPKAMEVVAELIAKLPDREIDGNLSPELEAKVWEIRMPQLSEEEKLAVEFDRLWFDYDRILYGDSVRSMTENVEELTQEIKTEGTERISDILREIVTEGVVPEEVERAKELLDKLSEYKPLAKVEEVEEQNYNMIDNVLNNGAEKAKKEADRKEMEKPHGRVSLKERLAEKKAIITGNDKAADTQENVKKNQREM